MDKQIAQKNTEIESLNRTIKEKDAEIRTKVDEISTMKQEIQRNIEEVKQLNSRMDTREQALNNASLFHSGNAKRRRTGL